MPAALEAREQLERVVLPFWLKNGIDSKFGGFFTSFDNRGHQRLSTDKFTWSQGRFVWLLARAAALARLGHLEADPSELLALAIRGAKFLLQHAVLADGRTRFVVGRDGGTPEIHGQPSRSVYADWFVAMGLCELARQTEQTKWLDCAAPILERSQRDHLAGIAPTPPYRVPSGHEAFGPRMILTNTLLVAAQAAKALDYRKERMREQLRAALEEMLTHRQPDGTFTEMSGPNPQSLVSRHRVPGHAIEGIWVALEALDFLDDPRSRLPLLDSLIASCELGWDPDFGGILRYTDSHAPIKPSGITSGTDYEKLVNTTWASKLWWVHSEASAATALAKFRYGHEPANEWFERIWEYTITTFPAGEEGEEWIQIRDRHGNPLDRVVALPVKDPFHIVRNLMQIIESQPH